MTFTNAKQKQSRRRPLPLSACALGIAVGLYAAGASALPTSVVTVGMGQSATGAMADPAKRAADAVSISAIDFKRGDGGSGKLILSFTGTAAPDLRTVGSNVVVDIGNAMLPASLQRPINVADFATPVQRVEARATSNGAQLVLGTKGRFESMAYQSGNQYIVELVPKAASAVAMSEPGKSAAMGATASASATATSVKYNGAPLTFNFQDVPVRTVLKLIADEAKLNIVAADTVSGNVTLRLINVPWDQALDLVMQTKQLDKRRSGNVIWVAPQKEIADFEQAKADARISMDERAEKVTEYIPINYANAEDIARLLTEESKGNAQGGAGGGGRGGAGGQGGQDRGFLSSRGSISFDKRTNTLLVVDIPDRVQGIKDLVQKLDKPVDQVVIEARIVIANENVARELGAKFGITGVKRDGKLYYSDSVANNAKNQNSLLDAIDQNSTNPPPDVPARPSMTRGLMWNMPAALETAGGSLALSILNAGYALDIELSAIQQQGRGEVISNPRIVTSNQKEAVIRQGKEIGYLTVTGTGGQLTPTVNFKEALLELKVTPTITNDGRVFLNLGVKKDELDGFVDMGTFGQVPQIAKREINTAVLVEDGQTVVIGGVYEFSDRTEMTKIPLLGDLPIIGNLFRNKNRSKSKAELLVFVTPKVMRVSQR